MAILLATQFLCATFVATELQFRLQESVYKKEIVNVIGLGSSVPFLSHHSRASNLKLLF